MPSRPDAVVFDMDGTLFASHGPTVGAYQATVVAAGLPAPTDAAVVAAYPAGPPAALLTVLLGRPAGEDEVATYHRELAARAHEVEVYDGVERLLDAATVPLGVFTGASTAAADLLLAGAGLRARFATVVGGDRVPRQKPDPAGLRLACDELGVRPQRAAFVGDSPLDLGAASAAGSLAVAAAWGHLHDPGAHADVVARHPLDLLALVGAR